MILIEGVSSSQIFGCVLGKYEPASSDILLDCQDTSAACGAIPAPDKLLEKLHETTHYQENKEYQTKLDDSCCFDDLISRLKITS